MFIFCSYAEIDAVTADKLRGQAYVLEVIPDYAFDVKDMEEQGVVLYCPSSHGSRFSYYRPKCEDHVIGMEDRVGEFGDTTDPLVYRQEAKKKIYRIVCENHFVGYGAKIEEEVSNKLKGMPGVLAVLPDSLINNCRKVQSIARFSPTNRNYHLNDIFSYYRLSERNLERNSDNWLIVIKQPDGEFGSEEQIVDFCIQMLA
ncbi:hypothetical protein IFM89_025744 [Coptis chinensis]|uniref:MORF/ORRM1/DAG-like MORF domain-containing protein n=1 Tax=Coptis chinensis TaxID=261450 RepID=A0A835I5G3_9MAGN|nr:hypothetical protein IFM89_025744 [Coptis chinensis]